MEAKCAIYFVGGGIGHMCVGGQEDMWAARVERGRTHGSQQETSRTVSCEQH